MSRNYSLKEVKQIMFESIQSLLNTLFSDISQTFVTLFAIGIVILGILAALGGGDNQSKFKAGLLFCIFGLIVFLLAEPIVSYFQDNL